MSELSTSKSKVDHEIEGSKYMSEILYYTIWLIKPVNSKIRNSKKTTFNMHRENGITISILDLIKLKKDSKIKG